jgi:apolipoprotein N-acyltransferase
MDSSPKSAPRVLLTIAAILLSAAAYFWSYGLQPVWWLMWLAPLPLLLMAPRLPGWAAASMAFAALTLGGLDMWHYHRMLHFPLWLAVACLLEPAIVLVIAVLLYRAFFLRGHPWRAVLAFPAVLVAAEYLVSLSQGTFGNTAYTQLRNLPVLQLGALTGLWGIAFVTMLVPAMAAAALLLRDHARRRMAVALALIAVAVLAFGTFRLHFTPPAPATVLVGLAESHTPAHIFPQDGPATVALMQSYAQQVQALAAQGAKFIVLPEMTAVVVDSLSPQIDALFQQTARASGAQVLLGILHVTNHGAFNEARLYSPAGDIETVYRKHHLVPVAEGRTTPGTEISVLPQHIGNIGIEICRDMDYPELARRYGGNAVGLILVPAWEFGSDELWHGHMALMRGVEDGFTIVRTAKAGFLTVSDDRGRVLAEEATSPNREFTTMLAQVPVRHDATLYQKWGDWFAWLDLVLLSALLLSFLKKESQAPIEDLGNIHDRHKSKGVPVSG